MISKDAVIREIDLLMDEVYEVNEKYNHIHGVAPYIHMTGTVLLGKIKNLKEKINGL